MIWKQETSQWLTENHQNPTSALRYNDDIRNNSIFFLNNHIEKYLLDYNLQKKEDDLNNILFGGGFPVFAIAALSV